MVYRLYDVTMGYRGIRNIGDFICYKYPICVLLDCKSSNTNTLNFSMIRQYKDMVELSKLGVKGLFIGVVWWSIPNEKIIWIPIGTLEKIKSEGAKSFNIKMIDTKECFVIPSRKKRVYLTADYSELYEYFCLQMKENML